MLLCLKYFGLPFTINSSKSRLELIYWKPIWFSISGYKMRGFSNTDDIYFHIYAKKDNPEV